MYQVKPSEIEIVKENPFQNCRLGRLSYAEVLKTLITVNHTGCVISINGEWGAGKTTFIKMFKQMLENDGYSTLYFNAWDTDYISDPIIGLLGEMKTIRGGKTQNLMTAIDSISTVMAHVVPILGKKIVENYIGKEAAEVVEGVLEGGADIFKREIDRYKEEQQSILNFKKSLGAFVKDLNENKPLVFIVDELDRCTPHYAVKVLERIKHLFSVQQIVFLVSVDKGQLCNSIRGYYGSDRIDAEEYLRRFFDLEYVLPKPDYKEFVKFEFDRLDFETFLRKDNEIFRWKDSVIEICTIVLAETKLNLRQVQRLLSRLRLVYSTIVTGKNYESGAFLTPIFLLIYLRTVYYEVYYKIKEHELELQEFVDNIEECLPSSLFEKIRKDLFIERVLTAAFSNLVYMYSKDDRGFLKDQLYKDSDKNEVEIMFSVKRFDEYRVSEAFTHALINSRHNIDSLIKNVELYATIQED